MGRKELRIIHFNIRSIRENFDIHQVYLNNLEEQFDIIVMSEAWIGKDDFKEEWFNIKGFDIGYNSIKLNKASGVVFYIKDSISYNNVDMCMSACDFYGIRINNVTGIGNMVIGGVYRSEKMDLQVFNEDINRLMEQTADRKEKMILIGDFNIDMKSTEDYKMKEFENIIVANGYKQVITEITRPRTRGMKWNVQEDNEEEEGSIIDLVVTNVDKKLINVGRKLPKITDHYPIYCNVKIPVKRENYNVTKTKYDFDQIEKDFNNMEEEGLLEEKEEWEEWEEWEEEWEEWEWEVYNINITIFFI